MPRSLRPHMTEADRPGFLAGLQALEELCRESLTPPVRTHYWEALGPVLSLEEWDAVVRVAVHDIREYRVPLPAILIAYAQQARRAAQLQRLLTLCRPAGSSPRALPGHITCLRAFRSVEPFVAFLWPEAAHSVIDRQGEGGPANDVGHAKVGQVGKLVEECDR
jgi:hypothetical protein